MNDPFNLNEIKIMSPVKLKCNCNDNEICVRNNQTCETEGFCYQKLVFQIRNKRTIKKTIKGCSTSKQIEFYYCNRSSMKTNFICCNRDFCNKLPASKLKLNLKQNVHFLVFFLLLIVLISFIIFLLKKYFKKRKKRRIVEKQEADKTKKLVRLKDQIQFERLIKDGKFKKCHQGSRLGEKLFVKMFAKKIEQDYLNEIEIYSLILIRHENIVDFVGKDDLLIATIYSDLGSLTEFLDKNRNLTENQMLKLMLSAANGLSHLHQDIEFKPSIAHRNLSSDNFIVFDFPELKCKLTNFSKALTFAKFQTLESQEKLKQLKSIKCDLEYCPPEFFNQTINFKNFISFLRADVYSFSLIMCQIANHLEQEVVSNESNESESTKSEKSQAENSDNDQSDKTSATASKDGRNQEDEIIQIENTEPFEQDEIDEYRYLKPFEEHLDDSKSKYDQMKALLKDDTFITRPTIYFNESKVRTFNGYVISNLIKESWSNESSLRLTISRIVNDLTNVYKNHLNHLNNLNKNDN